MSDKNDLVNLEAQKYNDLTVISGIGKKVAKRLNDHCDIFTLNDLMNGSAGEIEACLKEAGQIGVSQRKIETWMADAQAYIAANPHLVPPTMEVESVAETAVPNPSAANKNKWEWLGAFIVEFRVRKKENRIVERQITIDRREIANGMWLEDNKQKNSVAIKGDQLFRWMVEEIGTELWPIPVDEPTQTAANKGVPPRETQPAETADTAKNGNTVAEPVDVKITQIAISQPPDKAEPIIISTSGQPLSQIVKAKSPITLTAAFELSAPLTNEETKKQIKYNGQFYLKHEETDEKIYLGSSKLNSIAPGKVDYTASLVETTLPPGNYRLRVVVMLHRIPPGADYFEIPLIQVVG